MKNPRHLLGTATVLIFACSGAGVHAQSMSAPVSAAEDGADATGIPIIIVTAQKRNENILDVPSSISVLGGDQLEKLGATQLSDFAGYVPGFTVSSGGIPGAARLTLRGISSNTSATVATYVDEVPLGSSSTYGDRGSLSLDLFPYDIERVEVLRGPQGTLYGANSLGGLLKYTTVLPDTNAFSVRAGGEIFDTAGAGELGWGIRTAVNVPLAKDLIGVRVSYFRQRNPGFIDNAATGEEDVNIGRQQGGRLAVLFQPTPDLSLKLSAVKQNLDYDGGTAITVSQPGLQPVGPGLSRSDILPTLYRQRLTLYNATVDWDFGPASLVSSTSYSRSHTNSTAGFGDLLPVLGVIGELNTENRLKKVTSELRLVSEADKPLEWLFGGYFTRETYAFRQSGDAIFPDGSPAQMFSPLLDATQPSRYTEYALFGNATYRLSDRFDITGGLRWTNNKQFFSQTNTGFLFNPANPASVLMVETRGSDDVLDYMASAQYRFAKDAMVYARVATGYRPGGPNIAFPGAPSSFDSDSLTNYEIGLKADFLDRRGRVDISLFHIDWKDMQVVLTTPASIPYFVNAPVKAISRGVEFSTQLMPTDGLTFAFNLAYTDATVRGDIPSLGAAKGDQVPNVARWTASGSANYAFALSGALTTTLSLGYRYTGDRFSRFSGDPRGVDLGDYFALDASIGVGNGQWTARLYARNLGNARGYTSDGGQVGPATRNLSIITPRTIGLAIDTSF